jgi:Zn-finger protein
MKDMVRRILERGISVSRLLAFLLFAPLVVCAEETPRTDAGVRSDEQEKGAQLWNERCGKCHTKHTSEQYTDEEWRKIVAHMRDKAELTNEEQRQIETFLRTTN